MATIAIPVPIVMEFEQDNGVNFKEVKHYNLIQGKNLLTHKVNLSINRGFSRANYIYSLRIRQSNKWSKQITGLFSTEFPNVFHGDLNNKKHLLICHLLDNGQGLRFYLFRNYYPWHLNAFLTSFKKKYL